MASKKSAKRSEQAVSNVSGIATKHELEIDLNFIGSYEESADTRTLASRQRLHDKMSEEVAEFLSKGGKIDKVERNLMTDPPKKPVSHYGQRPI